MSETNFIRFEDGNIININHISSIVKKQIVKPGDDKPYTIMLANGDEYDIADEVYGRLQEMLGEYCNMYYMW